jgi:hypothetical protein
MSDLVCGAPGLVRAADALLRIAGGRVVKLRVPMAATPSDDSEQLGLATPGFQDVELGPVAFRKARARLGVVEVPRYELMVSASSVKGLVGSLGYESVAVLFQVIAGVVVGERLLFVESCTASQVAGEIYCYRLGLRGPAGLVV